MILESNRVTKRFGNNVAVDQVTLELEKGKVYGILGPNGSGKTTFMKLVAGLLRPDAGELTVEGDAIGAITKGKVSYMSTENYIYEFMKVRMVKSYFSDLFPDFNGETFDRIVDELGLREDDKVSNLSTGQRNRLKLAVALARESKLVMLDEPLNGIDLVSREKIIKCIINEIKPNQTMLISSHLVGEIESILDEVILIQNGAVILKGDSDALRGEKSMSISGIYREVFGA